MTSQSLIRSWFAAQLNNAHLVKLLKTICLIISDVDGALTDGNIYVPHSDEEIKGFNVQDGYLIKHARKHGIHTAFLTGRRSEAIAARAHELGILPDLCIMGKRNKEESVTTLQNLCNVSKQETLIWGDDIPDYRTKHCAALFATPANAPFYIQHAADIVLPLRGGTGAFRLLMDLLLYVQEIHPLTSCIDEALKHHE